LLDIGKVDKKKKERGERGEKSEEREREREREKINEEKIFSDSCRVFLCYNSFM